jgi:K+-transporting ATPase ATPase C chain
MSLESLRALIRQHILGRPIGILGEPRVHALELNITLDRTLKGALDDAAH